MEPEFERLIVLAIVALLEDDSKITPRNLAAMVGCSISDIDNNLNKINTAVENLTKLKEIKDGSSLYS